MQTRAPGPADPLGRRRATFALDLRRRQVTMQLQSDPPREPAGWLAGGRQLIDTARYLIDRGGLAAARWHANQSQTARVRHRPRRRRAHSGPGGHYGRLVGRLHHKYHPFAAARYVRARRAAPSHWLETGNRWLCANVLREYS